MCSDVHTRVGTPYIKMCSDVQNRVGTPHIKMFTNVYPRGGSAHENVYCAQNRVGTAHKHVTGGDTALSQTTTTRFFFYRKPLYKKVRLKNQQK